MFFDVTSSLVHKYFRYFNQRTTLCAIVFSLLSATLVSLSLYLILFIEALMSGDLSAPLNAPTFTPLYERNINETFESFYLTVLLVPIIETLLFHVALIWVTVKIIKNISVSVILNALIFSYCHLSKDIFSSFHTIITGLFYAYGFLYWKRYKGTYNAGIQFTFTAHALHNFWGFLLDFIRLPWIFN